MSVSTEPYVLLENLENVDFCGLASLFYEVCKCAKNVYENRKMYNPNASVKDFQIDLEVNLRTEFSNCDEIEQGFSRFLFFNDKVHVLSLRLTHTDEWPLLVASCNTCSVFMIIDFEKESNKPLKVCEMIFRQNYS